MEKIYVNTENSKTNELDKFVFNLSQRPDSRRSNKHVSLHNFSIYYTWKNIKKHYKNKKLKVIVPTWNDELELLIILILCQNSRIYSIYH